MADSPNATARLCLRVSGLAIVLSQNECARFNYMPMNYKYLKKKMLLHLMQHSAII